MSNLTKKLIGLKPLFGSFSLILTNLSCYKSCSKCKRGFSVNGKLFIENLHTESLIAQRHIHYHMQSYDLQAHDLDITHELLNFVSSARKHYFQSQKERLAKEKSSKDCQLAELNEDILKLNTKAMLFKSTISDLLKSSDKALLDAEKKETLAEMRNEVTKTNALKRAATKKQEELDKTLAKKKVFIEEKDSL